jgi:uncharacterized membrane protein YfcA
MRNKLNFYNIPLAVLCIAGAAFIVALVLGYCNWQAVVISGAIGLILGIPAGIAVTRRIRRKDPAWPDDRPA